MNPTKPTSVRIPSLVPPAAAAARRGVSPAVTAPPQRLLPVPRLAPARSGGQTIYSLTGLRPSGRINDRSPLEKLGWAPGTRLAMQEEHGMVVVAAAGHGVFRIAAGGFLFLPVTVRRWCGLAPGDQILLVADPAAGWLVVYPPAAIDSMICAAHEALWGGEP
jgi:hypothetical protein